LDNKKENNLMPISTEFTCKCGKQKGWITEGEIKKEPCPKCGRQYKGKYDSKKLTIKAVEIQLKGKIK
jgi:Zn finger protein HypA/HybF involved in hydrogenase expression